MTRGTHRSKFQKVLACPNRPSANASKTSGVEQQKIVVAKQSKKIVEKSFDAIEQLTEINKKSLGLLDQAEKDPQFALKCIGELRNQIRLAKDIQETLYSQKEAMKFMEIVADTLREVSDDAYKQFIRKINHEKSIRSVLRFT